MRSSGFSCAFSCGMVRIVQGANRSRRLVSARERRERWCPIRTLSWSMERGPTAQTGARSFRCLQDQGFHVTAVQNPLTSLADDAEVTRRALAAQGGPTILVGHSYGGAVVTGSSPRSGRRAVSGWRARTERQGSGMLRSVCSINSAAAAREICCCWHPRDWTSATVSRCGFQADGCGRNSLPIS